MEFKQCKSLPPLTPYAPTWDFKVGTSPCNDIDLNSLSNLLLEKEREIKKLPLSTRDDGKPSDGNTGLGLNSTTARFQSYNLLTWGHPEINKLKSHIVKSLFEYNSACGNKTPVELYSHSWYNVLRFNQRITPHLHSVYPHCYLSGHFNVQVNKTSTCYLNPVNIINEPEVIEIENKPGELTLFPSYIFHYTTRHYSFNPRITIAFDINPIHLVNGIRL